MKHYNKNQLNPFYLKMTIVISIFICSFMLKDYEYYPIFLRFICFIVLMIKVVDNVLRNLFHKRVLTENVLVAVAAIVQVILSNIEDAVILLIIYQVILYFRPKRKKDFTEVKVKIKKKNKVKEILLSKVKPDDVLVLDKNEVLPVNGILLNKDVSMVYRGKREIYKSLDLIIADTCVKEDNVQIKVLEKYIDSDNYKIEKLLNKLDKEKNCQSKKIQKTISIVLVVISIILIFVPNFIFGEIQHYAIYIGSILFLVANFFEYLEILKRKDSAFIKKIVRNKIVINSFKNIDVLQKIKNVIFEKTKVLTLGKLRVTGVNTDDEEKLWKSLNYAEYNSNSIVAKTILDYKKIKIDPKLIKNYKEVESRGIECKVKDERIVVGNAYFLKDKNIEFEKELSVGTVIYVAVNNKYIGNVVLSDSIKNSTKGVIQDLKSLGIKQIFAMSGDNERIVDVVSKELGITDKYSNLTIDDKKFWTKHLKEHHKGKTLFVGSANTEAELLNLADVSVVLENSEEVNNKSDIVIRSSDLVLLPEIIRLVSSYKKDKRRINYMFICIKVIWVLLALLNVLPIWLPLLFENVFLKIESSK